MHAPPKAKHDSVHCDIAYTHTHTYTHTYTHTHTHTHTNTHHTSKILSFTNISIMNDMGVLSHPLI